MDFLQNLGIDMYAIGAAIDDDNIDKAYQLVQDNPNITKEEFLRTMRIEEYVENTIPHKYRNYGNGDFDADKMFKDIQAHVESGNDGVVYQDLIKKEREVAQFSIYGWIAKKYKSELFLLVY